MMKSICCRIDVTAFGHYKYYIGPILISRGACSALALATVLSSTLGVRLKPILALYRAI